MIEIIEFINASFFTYIFFKMNFLKFSSKNTEKEVKEVETTSVILYQVIVRCILTERDYPSTLIFKDEKKAEDYKSEYASALIKENVFKTQQEFSIRIEPLKALL